MLHRQHNKTMKEYIKILSQTNLFTGIGQQEIESILKCMHTRYAEYEKGETVIAEGSIVNDIGIVVSGHGRSIKQEVTGKVSIITLLKSGSFIGILLAASKERKSPVTVEAADNLSVLFFPVERLICRCIKTCRKHNILLRNYIDCIAEKALVLHDRNDCLIKSTVREKILTYLRRMASEKESSVFTVSLDRNGMAQYLNVERSALSRELSRMKKDGVIDYYKNSFKLL